MKNGVFIVFFGLVAAAFLSVDALLWIKFNPHGFKLISVAILTRLFGLSAAFVSFKYYKKEISNKL